MTYRLALVFLLLPFFAEGQQCSCVQKFHFIRHELETNYVGYRDKVNPSTKKEFDRLTAEYLAKVKKNTNPVYCQALLREWIDFFKDGHVQLLSGKDVAYNDTTQLQQRIKNAEVISIPEAKLKQLNNADSLEEGMYISLDDSTYTIAIIKDQNEFRDFVGVVVSSRTDHWKPGQVKLEIQKPRHNKYYSVVSYNYYHVPSLREFYFSGTSFDGGAWTKMGRSEPQRPHSAGSFTWKRVDARKLIDSTLYIQIGTFNLSNSRAIDSVFRANEAALKTTPNLVLDLRKNGGGGDGAYSPITPYLYTNPVQRDGSVVYATEDNIERVSKSLSNPDLPADTKKSIERKISLMKQNVGKMVSLAADDSVVRVSIEPYPKRVVVLIDGSCASTTEQFLLAAGQSKKVTIMGQHTYGELDYSNWLAAPSPCSDIEFHYSSTRSSRVDKGTGIDNIGIKPDIVLPNDKDWIEEALEYLKK